MTHVVMSVTHENDVRFALGGLMSYLRYLCLLAYIGVQHILCFVVFLFYLYSFCVPCLLSYPLDCSVLIAYSVFSSVYFTSLSVSLS